MPSEVPLKTLVVEQVVPAEQLTMVLGEFQSRGVTLSFAEAKHSLREAIRRIGLEDAIGTDRFYESIEEGVRAFAGRQK